MITKEALEKATAPYLGADGRPEGPHLRNLVELKANPDCSKIEVAIHKALPEHPALGPHLQEFLDALAQAILNEPLNVRPGGARTAQGVTITWSGEKLTFAKKKGLLGLFT